MTTTPPFTLRPATPADTGEIRRLILGLADYERLNQHATLTEADLRSALFGESPRAFAVLADVAGQSVGIALYYYTFSTFKARPNIFLEDLFVEPVHRGSGIGLGLMRHLARLAIEQNCARVDWQVLNWNKPSIDFYHRLGAKVVEDWQTLQLGGDALAALAEGNSHG